MDTHYIELPISEIQLDYNNPRIARMLEIYRSEDINSDALAMALGSSESTYESLKESIRSNGGIIHPIVVNRTNDNKYVVIEGNTRVQIYRKFIQEGIPGKWDTIRAIVYADLADEMVHSIRLQAHLVGPREWDPYSKAKYLNYLYNEAKLPMNLIISFCGGKSSEIQNMIAAYNDMENYYRPLCDDDTRFDHRKFSAFVELQKRNIIDSIIYHKYSKDNFSEWVMNGNIDRLQDVRRIPDILKSKAASKAFLSENSTEALKVLAVEEISSDNLKDIPYELLASELAKRLRNIKHNEILHLKTDVTYSDKLDSLQSASDELQFVLEEIRGA